MCQFHLQKNNIPHLTRVMLVAEQRVGLPSQLRHKYFFNNIPHLTRVVLVAEQRVGLPSQLHHKRDVILDLLIDWLITETRPLFSKTLINCRNGSLTGLWALTLKSENLYASSSRVAAGLKKNPKDDLRATCVLETCNLNVYASFGLIKLISTQILWK